MCYINKAHPVIDTRWANHLPITRSILYFSSSPNVSNKLSGDEFFFVCADNVVRYIVCSFVTSVVCLICQLDNLSTNRLCFIVSVFARETGICFSMPKSCSW